MDERLVEIGNHHPEADWSTGIGAGDFDVIEVHEVFPGFQQFVDLFRFRRPHIPLIGNCMVDDLDDIARFPVDLFFVGAFDIEIEPLFDPFDGFIALVGDVF